MTANAPLHRLGLVEMLDAIEARRCDAADIVESCLARIATVEPALGAWAHLEVRTEWLERWQRSRAHHRELPFHGLPMGVKDTIDVAGMQAERGSPIWRGRIATEDAACVARLAAAGLQVAGKTVTTEFAYFAPGKTRNPYHPDHTPGGSSSGSAAAVAAAMVPVALGSQTAASVIRPASFCGIAAYVATVGRFSLRGVMPLAWSFDAPGVLARSAADLERVHDALAGETAPPAAPPAPARLFAFDARAFGEIDPAMAAAFESALAELARRGVDIRRPADPKAGAAWPALHQRWMADEAAQTLAFETATAPDSMSAALRQLLQDGATVTPAERDELQARRAGARAEFEALIDGCDAVIAPAAPGPAPAGLQATGSPFASRPWQLLGLPQVALPLARDAQGLPLGIQIVGRPRSDRHLLGLARWLEREMGWCWLPPAGLD